MIDYYIEEYGKACAQKQRCKEQMRQLIKVAHEHRVYPSLYGNSSLNLHWFLNHANEWVEIIQRYDRSIKLKKQDIIDYVARMEPYKDVA
tara:strand:- start:217 stop:486 length:270 start_codon:yes stop_codon:yes gene_type:complete